MKIIFLLGVVLLDVTFGQISCGAGGQPHRCGCNVDSDCKTGDKCSDNECITPECTDNADCKDGVCDVNNTPDYLECQYCEDNNCIPGKKSDKGLGT